MNSPGRSAPHGLRPFGASSPWLVLAAPQFLSVAKAIVLNSPPGTAELGKVRWGTFPDGTPDISLDASAIEGRDVLLVGGLQPGDLISFFAVAFAVPRYLARTFVCVVPYFPTGTMERVEKEGEVATAKTLARIISATPSPQVGDSTYLFFDIHALATRFYFGDRVKVLLATAVPMLLRHLDAVKRREGSFPVICFPDEGAKKRFRKFFINEENDRKFDVAVCVKTRVQDKREIVLSEGAVKDRSVVIVDDLVQSGSTLRVCRNVLYGLGARRVSAYVTHGVFPNGSWRKFLVDKHGLELESKEKGFYELILTDSIPVVAQAIGSARPFVVLTIADAVVSMMHGKLLPTKGLPLDSHL
jgi:phosphoribosylpyrophosphate synthetase